MSFLYLDKDLINKSTGDKGSNLAKEIQEAHKKASGGVPDSRGNIADMMSHLQESGYSKEEVHDALKKMQLRGDLVLYRNDNTNKLTKEDEENQLDIAGNPRHIVYFEGYKDNIEPLEGESKKESPAKNKEESKQQSAKAGKPKVSQDSSDIYSTAAEDYKGIDPIDHYKIAKYHEKNDYPAGAEAHKQMARVKTKDYSADEHRDLVTKLNINGLYGFSEYHEDAAWDSELEADTEDAQSTDPEDYKDTEPLEHYKMAKYNEEQGNSSVAEAHKQMAQQKTKDYSSEEHEDLVTKLFLNEMGSFADHHREASIQATPTEEELSGSEESEPKKKPSSEGEKSDKKPRSEDGNKKESKTQEKPDPKKETPAKDQPQPKEEGSSKEQPKEDSESESVKQARALDYKAKAAKLKQTIDEHLSSGDLSPEEEAKLQHISETMDSHSNLEGAPSEDQIKELQELEKISGEHSKPPENKEGAQKQPEEQKKPPKGAFKDDPSSKPQAAAEEEGGGGKKGDGTDWEYWGRPGTPPPDKGWEKSPTGKWRRPRGAGGAGGSSGGGSGKVSVSSKGPSLKGAFQQGRAAGASLASAASSGSGAGGIAETAVNYASQGAMSAGHHLLKKPAQKKAQQQTKPTQGQSSLGKSMSLYLDLYKADSPTTVMPRTESQAKVEYESSYAKVTPGVTGGGPSLKEDDPKEGRQWKHSEEDSVEAEVDEMLEDREPDNDEEETSKSLSILKTLNTVVTQDVQKHLPTETEMKFLIEELGHSPEEVKKGQVFITGKNRHRFNEWAHNNLIKSIQSLSGRLV